MLYLIGMVLGVLWLAGLITGYTMGGFIHVFAVIAFIMVVLNFYLGGHVPSEE